MKMLVLGVPFACLVMWLLITGQVWAGIAVMAVPAIYNLFKPEVKS